MMPRWAHYLNFERQYYHFKWSPHLVETRNKIKKAKGESQPQKANPVVTEISVGIRFKKTRKDYGRTSSMALENYKLKDKDNEQILQ